jgi:hypothetical protein
MRFTTAEDDSTLLSKPVQERVKVLWPVIGLLGVFWAAIVLLLSPNTWARTPVGPVSEHCATFSADHWSIAVELARTRVGAARRESCGGNGHSESGGVVAEQAVPVELQMPVPIISQELAAEVQGVSGVQMMMGVQMPLLLSQTEPEAQLMVADVELSRAPES